MNPALKAGSPKPAHSEAYAKAMQEGIVSSELPIQAFQIQPNSLDLRLSAIGYRIQCSFLPGEEGLQQKLNRYLWYEFEVSEEGVVLERNQIYLFPLYESLKLPQELCGRANPKSSTGRLDVFTRIVTEFGTSFDDVSAGYEGKLS